MFSFWISSYTNLTSALPDLSLSSPPLVEAAGRFSCGSAGWSRWYPAGSDGDGSGSGPDHWPAAGHSSRGHGHPRTRSAAHAGSAAQRPGAALPLHSHRLSSHANIKHRYDHNKHSTDMHFVMFCFKATHYENKMEIVCNSTG